MRIQRISLLRIRFQSSAAALLLAVTLRAAGASASDSPDSAAADAPAEPLTEVVVSARKRLERLQDVPLAVSSLSGDQMEHRGVKDLVDVANALPGVSFADSQSGRGTFAIRGISTSSEVPTVELFVDDIPISSRFNEITGAADPDILDVSRVGFSRDRKGLSTAAAPWAVQSNSSRIARIPTSSASIPAAKPARRTAEIRSSRRVPVTVLLVDDHAEVRAGSRRLLEQDPRLRVVGEASDASEALRRDRELTPDVIVLDIALPRMGGFETLRRVLRRRPSARVSGSIA
jgi:hypothetical protein